MITYTRYIRSLTKGSKASPRGIATSQLRDESFSFFPGRVVRRIKDNPAIGFVELLQFIAGTFNVENIEAVAPNARLDLFTHQSAYGPRVYNEAKKMDQFAEVLRELSKDKASRRAVVMIAHPTDSPETRPCTLSMQFQLDRGFLHNTITMRSSDAVWGLPYDMIQFGGITMMLAQCLRVLPGISTINIGNAHVYDETVHLTKQATDNWVFDLPLFTGSIHAAEPPIYILEEYRDWANEILDKTPSRNELCEIMQLRQQPKLSSKNRG